MAPTPRRLLSLALLALITAGPVGAQTTTTPEPVFVASFTPARVDSASKPAPEDDVLAARVEELEREVAALNEKAAGAVEFSGEVFTRYGLATSGTGGGRAANSFSLDRWHLNAKARLSDAVHFRGTTDVVPADPGVGLGYTVVVKYAYADWKAQPWLALRAGIIPTGWQNHVSGVWGYDAAIQTLAHGRRHVSIADLGAAALATLPASLGQAALQVHNGNGFRRLETDRFKDVSGRLILTPFARGGGALAGLQAGGHVYAGRYDDGRERTRWGGLLAYASSRAAVGLNAERRRDGEAGGTGVGAFGRVRLAEVGGIGAFSVFGIADVYAPDAEADGGDLRSAVGLAYAPVAPLTLLLHYQQTTADAPRFERYDGTFTDVDGGLFLNARITY